MLDVWNYTMPVADMVTNASIVTGIDPVDANTTAEWIRLGVANFPDLNVTRQLVLDLAPEILAVNPSYDERGLLGLAFHPDFATNGR